MKEIVVIPVYQPEKVLEKLVDELWEEGYLVLLVDDGSSEEYAPVFEGLRDRAVVLRHEQNQGKGAAIKTALSYIHDWLWDYEWIGLMDGDGQHLVSDMKRLLQRAKEEKEGLILGVRKVAKKDMPLRSWIGNALTRQIFRLLGGTYVSDTQSGLRAFSKQLLPLLLDVEGSRYEYETNVLMTCARKKIPIIEVPIHTLYEDDQNSTSHFRVLRDSLRIYWQFIKFALSSFSSFCLDYLLFGLFLLLFPKGAFQAFAANLAARFLSAYYNYHVNVRFVFGEKGSGERALQYFALALGIFGMNNLLLTLFYQGMGLPVMLAKLLTEFLLFVISFLVQKVFIFHRGTERRAVYEYLQG